MTRVFVSHAHADGAFVESVLLPVLRDEGLTPWYSKDDIAGGAEWERQIKASLDAADLLLVVLSPRAAGSKWVHAEVSWGLHRLADRVVTVLVEPCQPADIHMRLEPIQYVDFQGDQPKAIERLKLACRSAMAGRTNPPSPATAPASAFQRDWGGGESGANPELLPAVDTSTAVLEKWIHLAERSPRARAVPFLIWCLAQADREIVAHADRVLTKLGNEAIEDGLAECAASSDEVRVEMALVGFDKVRARRELVSLLDRLIERLPDGRVRERATALFERKRMGLEIEDVRQHVARVDSRLSIERALGQGLLATSYVAKDKDSDGKRVVRILQRRFVDQPLVRARFLDAARRSTELVHHHLVMTRWSRGDHERGLFFVVRDFVEGPTLREVMDEYARTNRRFSPRQIARIVRQVLLCLKESKLYARMSVHGGIRPGNLFFLSQAGGDQVVIGDVAPFLPASELGLATRVQDLLYVAPEVLLGEADVAPNAEAGVRYDLYAVGALAYELFCGMPPIVAPNVRKLLTSFANTIVRLPSQLAGREAPGIDDLLLPLLEREPGRRTASLDAALELLSAFERRLDGSSPRPAHTLSVISPTVIGRLADNETNMSLRAMATVHASPPRRPADDDTATTRFPRKYSVADASNRPTKPNALTERLLGESIGGRYRIDKRLGVGGMGSVYLAVDTMLDRKVAVKFLRPEMVGEPEVAARFTREGRVLASLDHPGIVQVFDVGLLGDVPYLVMQLLDGGTLRDRMRLQPQTVSEVVRWLEPIALALDYLHDHGIVHRDVKPDNVLFDVSGKCVLADFGISRLDRSACDPDEAHTVVGMSIGTPRYMPPEQWQGLAGPATDQFALAMTVVDALSSGNLSVGANLSEAMRNAETRAAMLHALALPRRSLAALERALAPDPKVRHASCSAMVAEMRLGSADPKLSTAKQRSWFGRWFRR